MSQSRGVPKLIITRKMRPLDYAVQVIIDFNRGIDRIGLIAYGKNICVLADTIAEVKKRLKDSVKIVAWDIDSRRTRRGRESFLYIELVYRPEF